MTSPPKVELQDLLNATGLGFGYLLTALIASLLNAAEEPKNPTHAMTAIAVCEKLRGYADRPRSPMPINVIASLLNNLCPKAEATEPRYAALILSVWQKQPWDPRALAHEILKVSEEIAKEPT